MERNMEKRKMNLNIFTSLKMGLQFQNSLLACFLIHFNYSRSVYKKVCDKIKMWGKPRALCRLDIIINVKECLEFMVPKDLFKICPHSLTYCT